MGRDAKRAKLGVSQGNSTSRHELIFGAAVHGP